MGLSHPASIDAEQTVIGLCLSYESASLEAIDILEPSDFYDGKHQIIWETIIELVNSGSPIDLLTVTQRLNDTNQLINIGGASYLAYLVDQYEFASVNNLKTYCDVIRDKSLRRKMMLTAKQIHSLAKDESQDIDNLLAQAELILSNVAKVNDGQMEQVGIIAKPLWSEMYEHKDDSTPSGLETGFIDLDNILGGLQRQDLIVLAARPSMGKTALGLQMCFNVARKFGLPSIFFSAEMPKKQIVTRLVCNIVGIDHHRVRTKKLNPGEWANALAFVEKLKEVPLVIDDSSNLTSAKIRSRAKRFKAQHGEIGVIAIDYLNLLKDTMTIKDGINMPKQIGIVTANLKDLARELDCPLILLSQLSRNVEKRGNRRPMLSDLRESGEIEQHADVVLLIYRDEYYNSSSSQKGIAEVIVAKQRNGPTGVVELSFQPEFARFANLARRPYRENQV